MRTLWLIIVLVAVASGTATALPVPESAPPPGTLSGPYSFVVEDLREGSRQLLGEVDGTPWVLPAEEGSPAHWLGEVVRAGLRRSGVATSVEVARGEADFGLRVHAFACSTTASRCTSDLELIFAGSSVKRWVEDMPFPASDRASAELLLGSLAHRIASSVASVELPVRVRRSLPEKSVSSVTSTSGLGIERLGPPVEERCEDQVRDPEDLRQRKRALGRGEWRLWKALREHGAEGARIIADWLHEESDAPENHRRDAALHVLACAAGEEWKSAFLILVWDEHLEAILEAARGRSPHFSESRARWLVQESPQHLQPLVGKALVGGRKSYSATGMAMLGIGFKKGELRVTPTPPSDVNIQAAKDLLQDDPREEVWEETLDAIGHLMSYDVPAQEAWGRVLLLGLTRSHEDWPSIRTHSALQMGRGLPEGFEQAVEWVLRKGTSYELDALVGGLEDRIQRVGTSKRLEEALVRVTEEGWGPMRNEARRLLKRLDVVDKSER